MTAIRAGLTSYREQNTVPKEEYGWDTYEGRVIRYNLYTAYFNNTAYSTIETFSTRMKVDHKLYRFIRGIRNPVARQNRAFVNYTYQGSIDTEQLATGALPIALGNEALLEPLIQVIRWSNLNQNLGLYTRLAALLGDVGLWVVDDPLKRRVRIEVLHPSKIYDTRLDSAGNVKACVIQYEKTEEPELLAQNTRLNPIMQYQQTYTYRLEVDQNEFRTFKDGEPFDYVTMRANGVYSAWANTVGFVPLVVAHADTLDLKWGINPFYSSLNKINEINDQASVIGDSIRQVMKPILVAEGMTAGDLDASVTNRDDMSIIYASKPGTKLIPLVVPLDIGAASAHLKGLIDELEHDMPELKLQNLQENGGNLSGIAIRNLCSDSISSIENLRTNIDPPLMSALLMAVTIAGVGGYDGFTGFNAASYDNGQMDAYIQERDVIADDLDSTSLITMLTQVKDQPESIQRLMLAKGGYSEKQIEDVIADMSAQAETAASNQQSGDLTAVQDTFARLGISDLLPADNGGDNGNQQPSNPADANRTPVPS